MKYILKGLTAIGFVGLSSPGYCAEPIGGLLPALPSVTCEGTFTMSPSAKSSLNLPEVEIPALESKDLKVILNRIRKKYMGTAHKVGVLLPSLEGTVELENFYPSEGSSMVLVRKLENAVRIYRRGYSGLSGRVEVNGGQHDIKGARQIILRNISITSGRLT